MRFLNGLFWFLLAVVVSIFTYGNWKHVEINLWSGLIADVNLPLLLLFAFLAGFLPMAFWHWAVKWRLKQRIATAERSIGELTAAPVAVAPVPSPTEPPLPPAVAPTLV
ncbi:MAG: lipopolysaccharide assembly protein LapA domain-containing protein [Pseudomonadota bacterium]